MDQDLGGAFSLDVVERYDGPLRFVFRRDPPDTSQAVELILFRDPVGDVDGAVRRDGQADGAKILVPLDEGLWYRFERNPAWFQAELIDAMIAPTPHEQRAAIVRWETIRFVADDSRGGFAGSRDHWQRPGDLAVPTCEGMGPFAAISEPVAIVTVLNDLQ